MRTTYLGLELANPIVVSSSPYTATTHNIEQCARYGAGAVVLKSIFEEQVARNAAAWDDPSLGYGDAGEYLERYLGEVYKSEHLDLIRAGVQSGLPVIGSINCFSNSEMWVSYAVMMQEAGVTALELNVFLQPTDRRHTAQEVERLYAAIVARVTETVTIPVSVKLPMRLTNHLAVCDSLLGYGARGVVLYNRFFEPDIDVERLTFVESDPFSQPSELRNVLRSTALCASSLPQLDVAVSTGVHDGAGAVKAILCGARAVQVCTAIHRQGYEVITQMNEYIDDWADRHNFCSLDECRGWMDYGKAGADVLQRVQYMKYFPHGKQ